LFRLQAIGLLLWSVPHATDGTERNRGIHAEPAAWARALNENRPVIALFFHRINL
jgi:hypothetical protein